MVRRSVKSVTISGVFAVGIFVFYRVSVFSRFARLESKMFRICSMSPVDSKHRLGTTVWTRSKMEHGQLQKHLVTFRSSFN